MRGFKLVAGRLDTRIEILHRVNVRNPKTGSDRASWLPLAVVWAEVQDVLPSRADRVADVVDIARRPCRVRIRYRGDLTGELRLRIRGRDYRVVSGPIELGRREGMEMLAEDLTTEGQRP